MPNPTRCIDPVIKFCQECPYGWVRYPEWVESREDLADCSFESGCTLGFDQGRPEDEPTPAELAEFDGLYFPEVPGEADQEGGAAE